MSTESSTIDSKLAQGIAYFEQMLLVMPDDRQALEFLCVAYEQIGDTDKRRTALVALAGVLLKEGDIDSAERIGERLADYNTADVQEMLQKINRARHPTLTSAALPEDATDASNPGGTVPTTGSSPRPAPDENARRQTAIKAEVALVQNLAQARIIDETATGLALQRLTEYANASGLFLISALTILEKENSPLGEAAAAYVADTANAPPVPIENYNITDEFLHLLPEWLVRTRGVLPFGRLQDALLVASLNPLDPALRQEVEAAAHGPCIFYLAPPRAMDELLDRLFLGPGNVLPPASEAPEDS